MDRNTTVTCRRGGRPLSVSGLALLVLTASSCGLASRLVGHTTGQAGDPTANVTASPAYYQSCSPSGTDSSLVCLQITLQAIDNARAKEHLGPMALPADLGTLSVPQQLFIAIDDERVDRGLAPFTALTTALDKDAAKGAASAGLPPDPGPSYGDTRTEWLGAAINGLDADFSWIYDDGPGSGVTGCPSPGGSGCWEDRNLVLQAFGTSGTLVMGAVLDPTGDTEQGDQGGPSLAAVFAVGEKGTSAVDYTWAQAKSDLARGLLHPRPAPPANGSATGIPDPAANVAPDPDYTVICAPSGLDSSASCIQAVVAAIDHARALDGIRPILLPSDFVQLTVPEQMFVAIDRERVDRGLSPFIGLTAALDADAQKGADTANDPPDPGNTYTIDDTEWAGGSSNGLDAVYGWMYDDGVGSGNLDCPDRGGSGCWGHRHGILDNFGRVGTLEMGAALDPTGDDNQGDQGGTSMAVTLAVTDGTPGPFLYTWVQALAATPDGGTPASPASYSGPVEDLGPPSSSAATPRM